MQVTSSSIQMPQIQGAAANGLSENTEPKCCQLTCFGRTISLSNRDVVCLAVYSCLFLSVGIPVYFPVAGAVTGAAGGAAGAAAGAAAGFAGWWFADYVYDKCRHVAHTDSPVQLSLLTSNAPETSGEPTETFSPVNSRTLLTPPLYPSPSPSPGAPPPPYSNLPPPYSSLYTDPPSHQ